MRKINALFAIVLIVILASCASTKNTWSPIGAWDYTVSDTPNGDTFGKFIITEEDGKQVGKFMSSEYGDANITEFNIDENNLLNGKLFLAGMDLSISGTFEGEAFNGVIDAGPNGAFPIVANRKPDQ